MTITRKFGSKNMREIHFANGKSVLFSYATPRGGNRQPGQLLFDYSKVLHNDH